MNERIGVIKGTIKTFQVKRQKVFGWKCIECLEDFETETFLPIPFCQYCHAGDVEPAEIHIRYRWLEMKEIKGVKRRDRHE